MSKSKDMSIGIDLGTTYCCVACLDELGDPQVQKNADGELETPAALFFSRSGETVVGTRAKEMLPESPDRVVFDVKSAICTDTEYTVDFEKHTPTELTSVILERIVKDFCRTHSMESESKPYLRKATIGVPAHFGHSERETVLEAARNAGIGEPEILDEPTAVAIAYGYGHPDGGHKRILVFDLGGGTAEVTVLDVDGKSFSALSVESGRIGGLDFDGELKRLAVGKIVDKSGSDPENIQCDAFIQASLDLKTESLKKELSTSEKASESVAVSGKKVCFEITRREFEESSSYLLDSAFELIDRALDAASATADELDCFVLSGGSSRIPMVAEGIRRRYPDVRVTVCDPAFAVAKGAAIFAGRDSNDVEVDSILSKTYGIGIVSDGRRIVSNILYRNSRIPYESRKAFHPEAKGQAVASVEIYEDDADRGTPHTDIEDARRIGSFAFRLPEGCDKDTRVSVRLSVTRDGVLGVKAECGKQVGGCIIRTPSSTSSKGALSEDPDVTRDPSARAQRARARPEAPASRSWRGRGTTPCVAFPDGCSLSSRGPGSPRCIRGPRTSCGSAC